MQNKEIQVFITSVRNQIQAEHIVKNLTKSFPELKINFDLNDSELPFPCGHSILRVEGAAINSGNIIVKVKESGFNCAVLEDKICK